MVPFLLCAAGLTGSPAAPSTDDAVITIRIDGKERRLEGIRLKLEPSPELLKALQDMGEGTKGLRDSVQEASKVEAGVIYSTGYKDCLRDTGVVGVCLLISLAIAVFLWRKAT